MNNGGHAIAQHWNKTDEVETSEKILEFSFYHDKELLEAYILIFMAAFACLCCLFCYLGFHCSQTHFEQHGNYDCEMTKDITTNFTLSRRRESAYRSSSASVNYILNDVKGSITNLKDMDDDEEYFNHIRELVRQCKPHRSPPKRHVSVIKCPEKPKKVVSISDPAINTQPQEKAIRSPSLRLQREFHETAL